MLAPRVFLVFALAAAVLAESADELEQWTQASKCNCCKVVMTDIKAILINITGKLEPVFHKAIQAACQRYIKIQPFEKICEFINETLLHPLFEWLLKKEGEIDPEFDCQYMKFCPRPKGFEVFLRMLKVADVPDFH
ncbi:unnamed protein product [Haemonchus placei]|uniref:Saposin B-type domain-containing protein n=2 Tax=Haemonchus TaxID=6288 RepID=A0A0N4WT72_HAEPC|nr:unnamed protein product [Haemonchus contortus]VDO54063.1 unnamed protein product [Haemonchus placei]